MKAYLKQFPALLRVVHWAKLWQNAWRVQFVPRADGTSLVRSKSSDLVYCMPYARFGEASFIQFDMLHRGYHVHLTRKYTRPDFGISGEDTVVDCGGFIGGFSIAACKAGAERVIYVEPTPKSRRCGAVNFALQDCAQTVTIVPAGMGEAPGTATLNLSKTGADNSLFAPDGESSTGESIEIEITTFDDLVEKHGLDPARVFFKVEAEGYEVEVVQGMKAHLAARLVVDVGPERNGESPRDEIAGILTAKGYSDISHSEKCLFARL